MTLTTKVHRMLLAEPRAIWLDYGGAAGLADVLKNLSGAAFDGTHLWTVSDEGRTVEQLERVGADAFRLVRQMKLDDILAEAPPDGEADLEGIAVDSGRIWIAGSHARVRKKPEGDGALRSEIRGRPSRHVLGWFGVAGERGRMLPFQGDGSLRHRLRSDPFIGPVLDLPAKEGGLDIEGLAASPGSIFLGLRGPVIENHAVVLRLAVHADGAVGAHDPERIFLDLEGLGIRDLAVAGEELLVLAGPLTGAPGPFRLHAWPRASSPAATPPVLHTWEMNREHPEGVCPLALGGQEGVLVVYDSPEQHRISGSSVRADWYAFGD